MTRRHTKLWFVADRCLSVNPQTTARCTQAVGHAGPHCVGDPYYPDASWVVKCTERPCDYHEAFVHAPGYEECIWCGDRRLIKRAPAARPRDYQHLAKQGV